MGRTPENPILPTSKDRKLPVRVAVVGSIVMPLLLTLACDTRGAPTQEHKTLTPSVAGSTILPPTSELVQEYELTRIGNSLVDKTLAQEGDRAIKSVEFEFDPDYAPGTAGGSLAMEICFKGEGRYRILSEEKKPRPGWLVDVEYRHGKDECVTKHPVIELAEGDEEVVYLGVGNRPEETYNDMRTYEVERIKEGLNGIFSGKTDVDPTGIQLRDKP